MNRINLYLWHVSLSIWVFVAAGFLLQVESPPAWIKLAPYLLGLYSAALADGMRLPKLVWQSPALFRNSGVFLKCGDRRWRLLRWGAR